MQVQCLRWHLASLLVIASVCTASQAVAQDDVDEVETESIFGFTSGSSIGLQGEQEMSLETIANFGKAGGRYARTETKLSYEWTPSQFYSLELSALMASHAISGVSGLDDRRQIAFSGLSGEFSYLLVGRGPGAPIGVKVSLEPGWRRIDETAGARINGFELETKLSADTELVPNRLFLGINGSYEPEWTREASGDIEREATLGVSAALAYQPFSRFVIGAEVGYYRHYDGIGLNAFTGDAVYLGPTLFVKFARKMFLSAAWSAQISGRDVEIPGSLNLSEFSRHRAKLKVAIEF